MKSNKVIFVVPTLKHRNSHSLFFNKIKLIKKETAQVSGIEETFFEEINECYNENNIYGGLEIALESSNRHDTLGKIILSASTNISVKWE